jgi:beta-phosphoglucomutase family hydrolase
MLQGAIFDMDGVLVDNLKIHMKALGAIARRYGLELDEEYAMSLNGMGNADFFGAVFPREIIDRIGLDSLSGEKEALYREMYAPLLAPAPGLIELLDDLKAHGVKLAVGTSAITANLDFVLDGLGIRSRFDALVTSEMVAHAKPAPDIYLRALEKLGLPASACIVFEDAIAGIEAAAGAGVKSVALSTSTGADILDALPGVALTVGNFTTLDYRKLDALL